MASIKIEIDLYDQDTVEITREWFWSPSVETASQALDDLVTKAKAAAELPDYVQRELEHTVELDILLDRVQKVLDRDLRSKDAVTKALADIQLILDERTP